MNSIFIRIVVFILTFLSVIVLPWWISVPIIIFFNFYFQFYLEVLFFGFMFDVLYLVRYSFPYTGLSVATIFLLIIMFIKTRVKDF
jgi:hypothetical protein